MRGCNWRPVTIAQAASSDFPGTYPGIDDSWSFDKFQQASINIKILLTINHLIFVFNSEFSLAQNFRIDIIKVTDEKIEFDMIGIDAALANTFRRILIAEARYIIYVYYCRAK